MHYSRRCRNAYVLVDSLASGGNDQAQPAATMEECIYVEQLHRILSAAATRGGEIVRACRVSAIAIQQRRAGSNSAALTTGVRVIRGFEKLVLAVSRQSANKLSLRSELSLCVLASESSRTSEKNSKSYPRKKRKRQTGEPNVEPINEELQALANMRLA
jgi:hypothetical protein